MKKLITLILTVLIFAFGVCGIASANSINASTENENVITFEKEITEKRPARDRMPHTRRPVRRVTNLPYRY